MLNLDDRDVGKKEFIETVQKAKNYVLKNAEEILSGANSEGVNKQALEFIVMCLSQNVDTDFRSRFATPMFRAEITTFSQLRTGQEVTGHVKNVAAFGVFVDIGVEDSLLARTNLRVHVGDKVLVLIEKVNRATKKINGSIRMVIQENYVPNIMSAV
ncbi:unnamed protein product [Cyprideis torosa]|uniref:Uncharacterized protein n=1 Tax=Cyprideis torosa TaxID=163714 RepID=A0A7R8WYN3_9CRUS|nr:unnamed protein product [Cyprideis torosa]CAG0908737.1 unnamed protein product [Cyprideis torosa]